MNDIIKESAELFISLLAAELELKLDDVIKEKLPTWKTTAEERDKICQSIAKYWLKQKGIIG